ncbi:MAG: DUF2809 domain-containing protein [Patescibacteria group bacterium]
MVINNKRKIFLVFLILSLGLGLAIFFGPSLSPLRNHVGDMAAVMVMFSLLALFIKRTAAIVIITLSLAVGLEVFQLSAIIQRHTVLSDLVFGQTFDPVDLVVYALTVLALAVLHARLSKSPTLAQ